MSRNGPRTDEPPYEIEYPDRDDWNDDFLGERMPAEPSLSFERVRGVAVAGSPLPGPNDATYRGGVSVRLVADERERDAVFDLDRTPEDAGARLEAVDLDERVLIVVESGYGSGVVDHRWKRAEPAEDGIHLHGYYAAPQIRTHDLVSYRSVLAVDRPAEAPVEVARVSLTTSPDRRVHVDSTEGLVAFERDAGGRRRG